jgi:hypothetical protein
MSNANSKYFADTFLVHLGMDLSVSRSGALVWNARHGMALLRDLRRLGIW